MILSKILRFFAASIVFFIMSVSVLLSYFLLNVSTKCTYRECGITKVAIKYLKIELEINSSSFITTSGMPYYFYKHYSRKLNKEFFNTLTSILVELTTRSYEDVVVCPAGKAKSHKPRNSFVVYEVLQKEVSSKGFRKK